MCGRKQHGFAVMLFPIGKDRAIGRPPSRSVITPGAGARILPIGIETREGGAIFPIGITRWERGRKQNQPELRHR